MCAWSSSTTLVWNIYLSKKSWARYYHKCTKYSCNVSVILVRCLRNLNFLYRFFEKCSNIKFLKNPYNARRVVPCGRTDGQTDTHRHDENSRFLQFFESALKWVQFQKNAEININHASTLLVNFAVERKYLKIFHCFTVHFNSLNLIHQLMHFYTQ